LAILSVSLFHVCSAQRVLSHDFVTTVLPRKGQSGAARMVLNQTIDFAARWFKSWARNMLHLEFPWSVAELPAAIEPEFLQLGPL
jgi:hypothetical protein